MSVQAVALRQHWAGIAQGIQQDMLSYGQLQELLQQQFHAALRHDAQAMTSLGQAIESLAQELEQRRETRVNHARAILPQSHKVSMAQLFATLQSPLREQLQKLWDALEAKVLLCQQMNVRNCQLIMEQAEVMRHVLSHGVTQHDSDIYAPR